MKLNTMRRNTQAFTHEGGKASANITAEQQLRRSVMACLLWENTFYENGEDIAKRIQEESQKVSLQFLANLAIECRQKMNLRHVPLVLLSSLCKRGSGVGNEFVANVFPEVIMRADELAEFCMVHAYLNNTTPDKVKKVLSAQAKKGLAKAFNKFDSYQLAKYNRDSKIKLRDVLFMCHAKPKDEAQAEDFYKLINGTLPAPDTWEVALSGGADKKETFTRLLQENKLGYLALLRNLRNMTEADVDKYLIESALENTKGKDKILPFRFVAAARACPRLEPALDKAMLVSIGSMPRLKGKTIVLVDVSGSMKAKLSSKSDMNRIDAACALGSIINGEDVRVFSFSNNVVEVPYRKGMSGVDAISRSQHHGGTELGKAMTFINTLDYDRVIVITDEQTRYSLPNPKGKGYIINVASYSNGVGYGVYTKIDGFSENVLKYIYEIENN